MHNPSIFSLIDRAVHDYNMIEAGDRILLGASGGKDSTLLAEYLALRRCEPRSSPVCGEPFTLHAVTIQSDFAPPFPSKIAALFDKWGIPLECVNVEILHQVKEGQKMNCWWCSTRRRGELLRIALERGYNKIALGHHLDDILETLLMNMLEKGELATMTPSFAYSKYPVTVIRPLSLVTEDRIKDYAKEKGFVQHTCTCAYQGQAKLQGGAPPANRSKRIEARQKLETLTGHDERKKAMLFRSLHNVKTEYLP